MSKIIDGKAIAANLKEELKNEVIKLSERGKTPGLAVIIVGNNQASRAYVNNKKKACDNVGILSFEYALPQETTTKELLKLIEKLNKSKKVDGILCQLPLPKQIDEELILEAISPSKDVDAFHPYNVGNIVRNKYFLSPCTPSGIMEMLKYEGIDPAGKHCVIIGRSNIVGKPIAMLMLHADATVTICHSKTQNLRQITKQADILVVAVGIANIINGSMLKEGAVVIDVGMNFDKKGKRCGDVDFASAEPIASKITPVPGGVGPMTIALLLKNTVEAAKKSLEAK